MMIVNTQGHAVNTSGDRWMIDETVTLTFSPVAPSNPLAGIRFAEKRYLASMISTYRGSYIRTQKIAIDSLIKIANIETLLSDGFNLVDEMRNHWSGKLSRNVLLNSIRAVRNWYTWCSDQGLEAFDPDVTIALNSMTFRGNTIGKAVLRLDPDGGPLTEHEVASFNKALWRELRAVMAGGASAASLPLRVVVAALLMSTLGPNPGNLRQLEEGDLRAPVRPGDPFVLLMPQAKKVGIPWRGAFKKRLLPFELGRGVQALIEENRLLAPLGPLDETCGRPLFRRLKQDSRLEDTANVEASYRVPLSFFRDALTTVVDDLDLKNRIGARLAISPRRLRYTVAKRLVARGATPAQLMDILDHSSIKTVLIYFNCGLEMVPDLDKAMGPMAEALVALLEGRLAGPTIYVQPALSMLFKARSRSPAAAPTRCLACPKFHARDAQALRRLATSLHQDQGLVTEGDLERLRRAHEAARRCDEGV